MECYFSFFFLLIMIMRENSSVQTVIILQKATPEPSRESEPEAQNNPNRISGLAWKRFDTTQRVNCTTNPILRLLLSL